MSTCVFPMRLTVLTIIFYYLPYYSLTTVCFKNIILTENQNLLDKRLWIICERFSQPFKYKKGDSERGKKLNKLAFGRIFQL